MTQSGIYRIRNTVSGKVYIGSSANVQRRWKVHKAHLLRGIHHSPLLQRAWDKYGADAFVLEFLEPAEGKETLAAKETVHIAQADSANPSKGYNIAPAGYSTLGIKLGPHSEEHRRKIGEAHKGKKHSLEVRAAKSAMQKGRKMSPEWCAKIAASMTGKKFGPLSDEHKAKISAVHKGKKISPEHLERLRLLATGRPKSAEETAKRKASLVAYWAKRKASRASPEQLSILPPDQTPRDM